MERRGEGVRELAQAPKGYAVLPTSLGHEQRNAPFRTF